MITLLTFENPSLVQRLMLRMQRLRLWQSILSALGNAGLWVAVGIAVWRTRAWEHVPMWVLTAAAAAMLLIFAGGGLDLLHDRDAHLLQQHADQQIADQQPADEQQQQTAQPGTADL